jgi:cysteine desulfurase
MIYFDNAATTPVEPRVADLMFDILKNHYGNPSSVHAPGRASRVILEDARRTVASLCGVKPANIFFTSCGTEAINTAISGAVEALGVKTVITSPIEHHAVLHCVEHLENRSLIKTQYVKLLHNGHINTDHLEELLSSNENTLVCLMHANNEIGNLLDMDTVSELCSKYKALLLVDTVQSLGKYPLDFTKYNIHFAACSAHKFHGPKGSGFLYINNTMIPPLLYGGGQERRMRSGTENIAGIAGLSEALRLACGDMEENRKHITQLRNHMVELLQAGIDGLRINNDLSDRGLYNLLNVSFPAGAVSDMLLQRLDMDGVCASGGSACASGAVSLSPVLQAIGCDPGMPAIRFSFSKYNTMKEVDDCVAILLNILKSK